MDMIFCPLYSGSSGNALFVQYGSTRLLIDAGKSGKMIDEALDMIGVDPRTLDGILITHEHTDHICGAGVMMRKYKLPVYATEGTWAAMEDKLGRIPEGCRRSFDPYADFYLGEIGVVPFSTATKAKWYEKASRSVKNGDQDLCMSNGAFELMTHIWHPEQFEEKEKAAFEDMECLIPKKWDEVLTILYGKDYMTPPPEAERVAKHLDI